VPFTDPEQIRRYQTEWTKNRRLAWIAEQGGKCVQCGSTERLEVDHRDPAEKVSHRIWTWGESRRAPELAKCQVLCYECHHEKSRMEKTKPLIHGTYNAYRKKSCRCDECKAWRAEDMRAWRAKSKNAQNQQTHQ